MKKILRLSVVAISLQLSAFSIVGSASAQSVAAVSVDTNGVLLSRFSSFAATNGLLTTNSPLPWSEVTNLPTTLGGYGITNADTNGAALVVSNALGLLITSNTTAISSNATAITAVSNSLTNYALVTAALTNFGSGTLSSLTVTNNFFANNGASVTGVLNVSGSGVFGGASFFNNSVTLGAASGNTLTVNAGTLTASNATSLASNNIANVGSLRNLFLTNADTNGAAAVVSNAVNASLTAASNTLAAGITSNATAITAVSNSLTNYTPSAGLNSIAKNTNATALTNNGTNYTLSNATLISPTLSNAVSTGTGIDLKTSITATNLTNYTAPGLTSTASNQVVNFGTISNNFVWATNGGFPSNAYVGNNLTVTNNLSVNGNTTLGQSAAQSVVINAGTLTAANATNLSASSVANVAALESMQATNDTALMTRLTANQEDFFGPSVLNLPAAGASTSSTNGVNISFDSAGRIAFVGSPTVAGAFAMADVSRWDYAYASNLSQRLALKWTFFCGSDTSNNQCMGVFYGGNPVGGTNPVLTSDGLAVTWNLAKVITLQAKINGTALQSITVTNAAMSSGLDAGTDYVLSWNGTNTLTFLMAHYGGTTWSRPAVMATLVTTNNCSNDGLSDGNVHVIKFFTGTNGGGIYDALGNISRIFY